MAGIPGGLWQSAGRALAGEHSAPCPHLHGPTPTAHRAGGLAPAEASCYIQQFQSGLRGTEVKQSAPPTYHIKILLDSIPLSNIHISHQFLFQHSKSTYWDCTLNMIKKYHFLISPDELQKCIICLMSHLNDIRVQPGCLLKFLNRQIVTDSSAKIPWTLDHNAATGLLHHHFNKTICYIILYYIYLRFTLLWFTSCVAQYQTMTLYGHHSEYCYYCIILLDVRCT